MKGLPVWKACVVKSYMTNLPSLDDKLDEADPSDDLTENITDHPSELENSFFLFPEGNKTLLPLNRATIYFKPRRRCAGCRVYCTSSQFRSQNPAWSPTSNWPLAQAAGSISSSYKRSTISNSSLSHNIFSEQGFSAVTFLKPKKSNVACALLPYEAPTVEAEPTDSTH